jgi:small GTP-binding protein
LKKCIIIGKTNVGKTAFFINFAEYLGIKTFELEKKFPDGIEEYAKLSSRAAFAALVDEKYHKTKNIQSIVVTVPIGKGKKKIQLIDTAGLTDDIHPEIDVRKAISQTLSIIRESELILHILDASAAEKKELPSAFGMVDYQVAQFAQLKRGYVILANKIDLPDSSYGLKKIKQEFSGNLIIPISALNKTGFKEVKTFVIHNL